MPIIWKMLIIGKIPIFYKILILCKMPIFNIPIKCPAYV